MKPPFFVALDLPSSEAALEMAARLRPVTNRFKVGLELFAAAGPPVVRALVEEGDEVFLDLKLHDIPNTVAGAVRSMARLGVSWATMHASGGPAMMEAAAAAARESGGVRLLGVTVLTSLDASDLERTGVPATPAEQVERLARLALDSGADGLVCSPADAPRLREVLGAEPVLVCPGVRPAGSDTGDQKRVATPARAIESGATYLVVGRPVTGADDPLEAARRIAEETVG
jgi:orotidine-5'-phosphate decarboxylase